MSRRVPVNPGWGYVKRHTFSPGVRMGNLLFLSGQVSVDDDGNVVGRGDIVAQCRQIYRNIGRILAEAGASFGDVAMTTEFVTTFEGYKGTAEVRREVFGGDFPAATGVLVGGLTGRDFLIEINLIAVLPEA